MAKRRAPKTQQKPRSERALQPARKEVFPRGLCAPVSTPASAAQRSRLQDWFDEAGGPPDPLRDFIPLVDSLAYGDLRRMMMGVSIRMADLGHLEQARAIERILHPAAPSIFLEIDSESRQAERLVREIERTLNLAVRECPDEMARQVAMTILVARGLGCELVLPRPVARDELSKVIRDAFDGDAAERCVSVADLARVLYSRAAKACGYSEPSRALERSRKELERSALAAGRGSQPRAATATQTSTPASEQRAKSGS